MKILLQSRIDLLSKFGGDTNLIMDLFRELQKHGLFTEINKTKSSKKSFANYDLIHFFGIMRIHELYPIFLKAKELKKPIVITPIYEDLSYLDKYGRVGIEKIFGIFLSNNLKELLKGFTRSFKDKAQFKSAVLQLKTPYLKQQKELLEYADIVIASCDSEKKKILEDFKVSEKKIKVIPYCINTKETIGNYKLFKQKYKLSDFILCVGRIEPKKNQLKLLKALRDIKIPIVFVGSLSSYHKSYVNKFLKLIKKFPNVKYLNYLDKKMLLSAYAAARVHVLPSWFEAPGLVSMEAAINNCNIVTTNQGYAKDYFGNFAWYCDPNSISSIRKAVLEAYSKDNSNNLKNKIIDKYTWEKVMPNIIEMYKKLYSND